MPSGGAGVRGAAETLGMPAGRGVRIIFFLSPAGTALETGPSPARDPSAVTEDVALAPDAAEGAVTGVDVGAAEMFSAGCGLVAGEANGIVVRFSNCRAALFSFPRSRAGLEKAGV